MAELVLQNNGQLVTTSRIVAEKFEKRHDNVMATIKGLLKFKDTHKMFMESTYNNEQNGQSYPEYLMNRDGFSLLVMGFTGEKALQFKLDFIDAFNKMEQAIKNNAIAVIDQYKQQSLAVRQAGVENSRKRNEIKEHSNAIREREITLAENQQRLNAIEGLSDKAKADAYRETLLQEQLGIKPKQNIVGAVITKWRTPKQMADELPRYTANEIKDYIKVQGYKDTEHADYTSFVDGQGKRVPYLRYDVVVFDDVQNNLEQWLIDQGRLWTEKGQALSTEKTKEA